MAERSILAVAYTPVSGARSAQRAVAGFLKYVQHRDQHPEPRPAVEDLLKYVAHRDRSGSNARLFNRGGKVTDEHRLWLASYVGRSVANMPQPHWQRSGGAVDRRRAAYRFVLSPETAKGLDLAQLTRAAMAQLETDAGGLGPWLAAEHRNTAHPHVHVVLAARRQVGPGQYRTVILTRPRLQRMKDAIGREIIRQRGRELDLTQPAPITRLARRVPNNDANRPAPARWRRLRGRSPFPYLRSRSVTHLRHNLIVGTTLLRLRAVAARYQHQRERELELARSVREDWQR